jgi:hypothetical protein
VWEKIESSPGLLSCVRKRAARCLYSSALPIVSATAAISIGSSDPRDIRISLVRTVPDHARLAEEAARLTVVVTMAAQRHSHHPQADGA